MFADLLNIRVRIFQSHIESCDTDTHRIGIRAINICQIHTFRQLKQEISGTAARIQHFSYMFDIQMRNQLFYNFCGCIIRTARFPASHIFTGKIYKSQNVFSRLPDVFMCKKCRIFLTEIHCPLSVTNQCIQ